MCKNKNWIIKSTGNNKASSVRGLDINIINVSYRRVIYLINKHKIGQHAHAFKNFKLKNMFVSNYKHILLGGYIIMWLLSESLRLRPLMYQTRSRDSHKPIRWTKGVAWNSIYQLLTVTKHIFILVNSNIYWTINLLTFILSTCINIKYMY